MRVDAHWDTALHLRNHQSLEHLPEAHCDWQRFRKYVDIAFMALFIHPQKYTGEQQYAQFRDLATKLTADISDQAHGVKLLLSAAQLDAESPGKLVLMGAEGSGFLGGEECEALARLEEAFQLGLRYLGPTWNYANALAGGCMDGGGLSQLGRAVVKNCNERGILLDGAHLSAQSLTDLLSLSNAPIAVSHTASAMLCPAWKVRNLLDWQLKAVAEAGGVVGVCFVPEFIGGTPSLARVAEHIAYMAEIIGVEHVGLGSDFDGTELPPDIKGLQDLPRLDKELATHGFSAAEIALIMGGNFTRLLRQVLP